MDGCPLVELAAARTTLGQGNSTEKRTKRWLVTNAAVFLVEVSGACAVPLRFSVWGQ